MARKAGDPVWVLSTWKKDGDEWFIEVPGPYDWIDPAKVKTLDDAPSTVTEQLSDKAYRDQCAMAAMPQWPLVLPAAASPTLIAEWSYGMADAMIAERNRRDR